MIRNSVGLIWRGASAMMSASEKEIRMDETVYMRNIVGRVSRTTEDNPPAG
jgi:hypothetical protein